jgi:hypothetical protein
MKVVQCVLDREGMGPMVCWLEQRKDLKDGVQVTLKDHDHPEWLWNVRSVGTVVKDKDKINRPGAFFDSDL